MRSIFINYFQKDEPKIIEWLEHNATESKDKKWHFPSSEDSRCFIFLNNDTNDIEPEDLQNIQEVFGDDFGCLQVSVSGKIPGDKEITTIVLE